MFEKDDIIEALNQGITHLYDLKGYLNISKKRLIPLLDELVEEEIVYHERGSLIYGLKKIGKVELKDAGYGFISVLGEETDYYVSEHELNGIYDGDEVEFYPFKSNAKLLEADVLRITNRAHTFIIGSFEQKIRKGKLQSYIVSNNPKFKVKAIVKRLIPNLEEGMIIYSPITYVGTAIEAWELEIVGHKDDPGIEISQIALEYGFKVPFPDSVLNEIATIPDGVLESQKKNRRDFTNQLIFTIDGDDSKDFDDAISLTKNNDGTYDLGVYIADVSEYVKEASPLDIEAFKRGTSVYLADRVIPMIPHKLSNGICSLNPNVERLVLTCLMKLDEAGKLIDYEIVEGVIKSKYRMTYNLVNKILNQDEEIRSNYQELVPTLEEMAKLSDILRQRRYKKGGLDFEVPEYKFTLNPDGSPKTINLCTRDKAEMLIEDFMLLANETVAYNMQIMNYPCIYRIHEKPDQEKLFEVWKQAKVLDVSLPSINKKITSKNLQEALEVVDNHPLKPILNNLFLRSMMKAKYSNECLGHYALAMYYYCHFTSPIRRYPDLMVHRIIKSLILHPKNLDEDLAHFNDITSDIAIANSLSEKNSVECERRVNDMLYAWYMEKHLKDRFKGVITSITSFGLFVTIENGIEGLVTLNNLFGYYDYNPEGLSYSNGEITYRLGDEVEIIVISASRETRKIDFMFVEDYKKFYEEW